MENILNQIQLFPLSQMILWLFVLGCLYYALKWFKLPDDWEDRERERKILIMKERGLFLYSREKE